MDDLLVHRPADTLRTAAVDLLFDGGGIDRFTHILHHHVAQRFDAAGLGVDADPCDVYSSPRAALGDSGFAFAQHRFVFGAERRAQSVDVFQRLYLY